MGLQRIAREIPKSPADADGWMLFTREFLHIGTVEELNRLPKGAELVLSPVEDVIVKGVFASGDA